MDTPHCSTRPGRWRLLALGLAAILLASCATAPDSPEVEQVSLAYDGVYRAAPAQADHEYWYYLRFYPDDTVISISSTGDVDELARWFSRDNERVARGTYRLEGRTLAFEAESEYGVVEHRGEVAGPQRLWLDSHSRINGHRARRTYHFVPW